MSRNFGIDRRPGPDPDFWHGMTVGVPIALAIWAIAIAAAIGLYHLGAIL